MRKRAALHNLGCKVNAYETEAMQQLLETAGFEIVPFDREADVYVINTCAVTNMADRKSRQMIHRARKRNPSAIVAAVGCYVQTSTEKASSDLSADIVIGNNQKNHLVEAIAEFEKNRAREVCCIDINDGVQPYEPLHIEKTTEHTRAFIKVQDGCNQFCSYCIIPYARGRVRSRRIQDVLAEVRVLAQRGCREVVLTGIHLGSYGMGTNERLIDLIEAVHTVEGIDRIRLGSLEPRTVTEEFVRHLAELPKVCHHFHLSLQSGCDDTLRRMNRRYDTQEYRASCDLLRKYFIHPAITTDVIVGFPGETEEEFSETKRFVEEIGFYEMHIFKYSRRKGTVAARMEHQIEEAVKNRRSQELMQLEKKMSKAFRQYYVGKKLQILLEENCVLDGTSYMTGFTGEYVKAVIPCEENRSNQMATGKAKELLKEDLLLLVEFSE